MKTIAPSEARRRALKSAILTAAREGNAPDLASIQSNSRRWTKADYATLAHRFGIDADTLEIVTTVADDDAGDGDATGATDGDANDGTLQDMQSPQEQAAQADMAKLDELWRAMDMAGHRALVIDLAMRANAPAPVHVSPVTPGSAPHATIVGTRSAGRVFGITGPASGLPLPVYNAATAPAIDANYIMPACLPALLTMAVQHRQGIFLSGPAGTGKTTLAMQIAAHLGRPFVRVSCTANTDAAMLVGMTVPHDGGVKFQPGILTRAIVQPGIVLLIDEPSTARDGILYVLQALLDDARRIAVDETGDVFTMAQDAIVFLADNTNGQGDHTGAYTGTRTLSRALLDRVEMFAIDYMAPSQEIDLLIARTQCTRKLAELLVNYAVCTRAKVSEGELSTAVGLRRLVSWARLLMAGTTPADAAAIAVLNSASPDAREVLQQLLVTHMPSPTVTSAASGKA